MVKHRQLVALSFDSPSCPILNLHFAKAVDQYKLYCKDFDNVGRSVLKTRLLINSRTYSLPLQNEANSDKSILSEANYLKLFSLNRIISRHSINNKDWIFFISLLEPEKPVNKALFPLIIPQNFVKSKEYFTTWLLEQLLISKANTFMELSFETLYDLFQKIDAENPCTILCSDGQDLIIYQGSQSSFQYYYLRSTPPHQDNPFFKTGSMRFQLYDYDLTHTLILVSTEFIPHQDAKFLNLKQMMVIRCGEYIWNKDPKTCVDPKKEAVLAAPEALLSPSEALNKVCLVEIPSKAKGKKLSPSIMIGNEWTANLPQLYSLTHQTLYEYESAVYLSTHLFRLQPVSDLAQTILFYELSILADGLPITSVASNFVGAFGNHATYVEVKQPYTKLAVVSKSIVAISSSSETCFNTLHTERTIPLIWMPWDRIMMQAYLVPPELPESQLKVLSDYALTFVKRNNHDLYDILNDINRTIYEDYTYLSGSTTLETTPYDVYVNHCGVCQDFANLFICLARLLNIPARYRTGYIYTANVYEHPEQGDATHAWLEVFLPLVGWTGYDPTNNCRAGQEHLRVACGRTYSDTAPTSGTIYQGGGGETLSIQVKMVELTAVDLKKLDLICPKKG